MENYRDIHEYHNPCYYCVCQDCEKIKCRDCNCDNCEGGESGSVKKCFRNNKKSK